ncbi:MAG: nucleotidyltransferase domain-containing protein [Bacteroides sp.]|nr:nucleotidyltransferase domain-containing protein [Bacteroides sp.]MCM1457739.1 nucleotidyltransferase domain-containing protein [Lachnoclostridium sp.]
MKLIELNINKIIDICRNHKVKSLAVFGSVLTDRFNDKSDIDFLVDFENVSLDSFDYVDNFLSLLASLENLLGRTVDLVVGASMRNKYFIQNVNRTKKVIYG